MMVLSTVQYQCAMSLDGFIAGPGGDMQWMNDVDAVANPLFDGLAGDGGRHPVRRPHLPR